MNKASINGLHNWEGFDVTDFIDFATVDQHRGRRWNRTCVPIDINPFITHPAHKWLTTTLGTTCPTLFDKYNYLNYIKLIAVHVHPMDALPYFFFIFAESLYCNDPYLEDPYQEQSLATILASQDFSSCELDKVFINSAIN